MNELFTAAGKAARDLARGDIFWHVLWPPIVAAALWGTVGILIWAHGLALMAQIVPQLPWAGWEWVAHWAAVFLLLAAFAMLIYLTSLLLVAVIALPYLINYVAARDYPDLVRHGENAFWRSLANTLAAGGVFLFGGLLSLPLLLIPGVVLVLPLFWTAWLNQRTFRVDALIEHATAAEITQLVKAKKSSFYLAGTGCALLAHVPLLQLLAPVFTALVFVHLGLAALREQRRLQGIQV
ncbi:MAG: EI24 domain-containing protein [Rugosibacter sp.]|jgi:CysZ protein|nr:EI24 domain-containing protein [Rugosibacter sp.]